MPEVRVPIYHEADIVAARRAGRSMAETLGFQGADLTVIATAISELSRNIVKYAGHGEIVLWHDQNGRGPGIAVQARDQGPGIADLALAMQDGYSTSLGLGLGLPGAKRLMDAFDISSSLGQGTVVTTWKWRRP